MSFQDLQEFFQDDLRLPIRGKTYVVPSPDAKTGLLVQQLMELGMKQARLAAKQERLAAKRAAGERVLPEDEIQPGDELTAADLERLTLDDDAEGDMYQRLLGPAFHEMVADGVPWVMLKHAGLTASFWVNGNVEAAERYWASGGRPGEAEAPEPNRQARRAASKASGSTTRSPASTSGTRTRTTPRAKPRP